MALLRSRSLLRTVCCGVAVLAACAQGLKFDLGATHGQERCIRNFVAKDTLVVVTATVGGEKGDGMSVNMNVSRQSTLDTGRWTLDTGWPAGCLAGCLVVWLRRSANPPEPTDQRCRRQRVRPRQGDHRGAADRIHVARRRRL